MIVSQRQKYKKVPNHEISEQGIIDLEHVTPKRIHFGGFHTHALQRREGNSVGIFKLPFQETVVPIFHKFGLDLYKSKFNADQYYRTIDEEDEFERVEALMEKYKDVVFLRDLLDLSIALSNNYDGNIRTPIGELEYQAKYHKCRDSLLSIIEEVKRMISEFYYYREVDYICAIPPTNPDEYNLPREIVNGLEELQMENISEKVRWTSKEKSLKNATGIKEKLEILKESGLSIDDHLDVTNKVILLIDDLYMSGTTIQYVAMKLKEAGAFRILGLCIAKSRSNTAR